ncbi:hypothetical protein BCV73_31105 [Paenibacillus sp. SSG-1]|uniref:S-layer homology domain-containing protein n=1 Tax=Paenibacillus sp. SSG-1 TaxID=1443669 RepID=UPI000B7F62AD|nr:S-layer homology domain-containing protein [Paenibacillus sp. SSG-1]OXL87033.1 hypothetical protein BCV73_31105 [Paenibacillus sp. SSG-1]
MSNTSYPFKENSIVMNVQGGEKKVMKKILTVALSTAMAFSMFASVAFGDTAVTPQQKFDALAAKGIFNGYPDKQAHLEKEMTRAEFAKVITKLLGLKEVTGTLSYKDKGYDAKNWAVPYIEAVTAAGIMQGQDNVKKIFNYNGKVTIQEMATVLTRALKLEIPANPDNNAADWAKGYVQAAIDKGLISKDANFKANASRSQLVEAAYAIDQAANITFTYKVVDPSNVEFTLSTGEVVKVKLDTPLVANKETEVKFKDAAGNEYTAKVTYVVTTATKVQGVTASNLKEVEVAFDGTVDKATAEDADRYSIDSAVTVDSAVLLDDNKTVRLTVEGTLVNQKSYKISVTNVKAGDKSVSVSNFAFTPIDNALPEVVGVKALGTKAVKVTFSEPIKTASASNFKLDGKTFYGNVSKGARDVILKSYNTTDLSVGSHKLEISGVEDYNNFKALSKEVSFEVVEDTTAPKIASVSATLEKATVTFNEEVDPETVSASNVYWKSGSDKKTAASVKQISPEVYEFTFSGSNAFPGYETSLFVENVKDYSGNKITETEVKVRAEVDQTRPEVTSVALKKSDNKFFTVKFSKEVKVDDVKYFTLTKTNGDVVSLRNVKAVDGSSATVGKTFEVESYTALTDDSYNLKISGVRDTTKLQNTMNDYSGTLSGKDTAAPKYVSNSGNSSTRTLVINFNKALDPATVGDPSNYLVKINGKFTQLPEGTEVTPILDSKAVRIVFPQYIDNDKVEINTSNATRVANITAFKLLAIKDLSGNVIDELGGTEIAINTASAELAATKPVELTDSKVIKVRFDQPISEARISDFELANATRAYISDVVADGTNEVTVKISGTGISTTSLSDSNSTTPGIQLRVVANNSLKTTTGNSVLPAGKVVNVLDSVAPQVDLGDATKLSVTADGVILVPFSEVLDQTDATNYSRDLIVTNKRTGDVLSSATGYKTSVDNNVLKVALTVATTDEYTVQVRKNASEIQDLAGNKAAESSVYSTVVGGVNVSGPTVDMKVNGAVLNEGSVTRGPVVVTFATGNTATISKDGNTATPYTSGTAVADPGKYVVKVTNTANGLTTTRNFTIRTAGPVATGLPADGSVVNTDVTPTFAATEDVQSLTLKQNGVIKSYTKNTAITSDGVYELRAVDSLGNESIYKFTIDKTAPAVDSVTGSTAVTGLTIKLTEALNIANATDIKGKLKIVGSDATIDSAVYDNTAKTITVTITDGTDALNVGDTLQVDASSLTDVAGNQLTGVLATVADNAGTLVWK